VAGRLSAPGEYAARARVETVFAWVDQLSAVDIYEMASPAIDLDDRDARMDELERLADAAGRGALLDDAREALTNAVASRIATIRTYPYGMMTAGTARAEDQVAIVRALRDLVAVAVMRDRLEPDDARALAMPGLQVLGSRVPVLEDPAWADLATPLDDAAAPPEWAPTEEEWAVADAQARRDEIVELDRYSPPGTRVMRRGLFAVIGVFGVAGAILYGYAAQALPAALLVAGAVAALCWTFATWSPRRG
jgi:hypothetical protein